MINNFYFSSQLMEQEDVINLLNGDSGLFEEDIEKIKTYIKELNKENAELKKTIHEQGIYKEFYSAVDGIGEIRISRGEEHIKEFLELDPSKIFYTDIEGVKLKFKEPYTFEHFINYAYTYIMNTNWGDYLDNCAGVEDHNADKFILQFVIVQFKDELFNKFIEVLEYMYKTRGIYFSYYDVKEDKNSECSK